MKLNGSPEQMSPNVVQGMILYNIVSPGTLNNYRISEGGAYIDGYRIAWDDSKLLNFVSAKRQIIYAKIIKTPDAIAGYSDAYIDVEAKLYEADPPTEPHFILYQLETGPADLNPDNVWCVKNCPQLPEVLDRDEPLRKNSLLMDHRLFNQFEGPPWADVGILPVWYFKLEELGGVSCQEAVNQLTTLDVGPATPPNYVSRAKGKRGYAQFFDAYGGGPATCRQSPATLELWFCQDPNEGHVVSLWAYPLRDDIDMHLIYKDFDWELWWDATSKTIKARIGDGLGGWSGRSVQSLPIADFKNKWFHIILGYDLEGGGIGSDRLYIIIDNGPVSWQVGAGGAVGINNAQLFMGNNGALNQPFYGIIDEFGKFGNNEPFNRTIPDALYNFGLGNTYVPGNEGGTGASPRIAVYKNSQVINSGAQTKIAWANYIFGTFGYFDNVNDRLIVPENGQYLINFLATVDNPVAGDSYQIQLRIGGSVYKYFEFHAGDTDDFSLQFSVPMNMFTNQYVEIWIFQSNGARTLKAATTQSLFSFVKI